MLDANQEIEKRRLSTTLPYKRNPITQASICQNSTSKLLRSLLSRMPTLVDLATELLASAKAIEAHLESNNLPAPTFDNDTVSPLPKDLQAHRATLIDGADKLKRLAQGPEAVTMDMILHWAGQTSLRVIYEYDLVSHVPLEDSCSYASIAAASGLAEPLLRRFLRHCMASHIFAPAPNDEVRHTAISRLLATESDFRDLVGLQLDEFAPASSYIVEALRKFGSSAEQSDSAFALYEQARKLVAQASTADQRRLPPLQTVFSTLAQEPERGRRLGAGMRYLTRGEAWDLRNLLTGFDWTGVDRPDAVVVDVGGGHGSISRFLAQHTQHIHFIVQDIPATVKAGQDVLPADLQDRVEFMPHDFFTPQTEAADVYILRWILHNWADGYAEEILRNLVPAMKKGSRVVIFEWAAEDEPSTLATKRISM